MMPFVRLIGEMDIVPRGYGAAWIVPHRFEYVCLPVPLNRIAGALRAAYFWLRKPRVAASDVAVMTAVMDARAECIAIGAALEREQRQDALHRAYWQGRQHQHAFMLVEFERELRRDASCW